MTPEDRIRQALSMVNEDGEFLSASNGPISLWFGLSYASWLTIPRVLMEAMPPEWQKTMARLLHEFNEEFPHWMPDDMCLYVAGKRGGKYASLPKDLHNYRHPDREWLARQHRRFNNDEADKDIRGKP